MKNKQASLVLAGLISIGSIGLASATNIEYSATDLANVNPGEDLWQYSYSVSGNSFSADTGFTIYFDPSQYELLDPFPLAPNSDWDVLTLEPDPSLPDDGLYDAYALVDNADLSGPFTVSFVWLGGGASPGAQYFEVYEGIGFDVLESGNTSRASVLVPEPNVILLLGIGMMGFGGVRLIKNRKK